jgi:hypothetical protein
MRRRIVEFNSDRNKYGDHHGNWRKPDADNKTVSYGAVNQLLHEAR